MPTRPHYGPSGPHTDNRCTHGVMWGDRTDVAGSNGIPRCELCRLIPGLPRVLARRPDLPAPHPAYPANVVSRLGEDLYGVRFDADTFAAIRARDLLTTCPVWDQLHAMPIGVSLAKVAVPC